MDAVGLKALRAARWRVPRRFAPASALLVRLGMMGSKIPSSFRFATLVGIAAVATGCLEASSPYCEETITVLDSVDSPTPAGPAAADILAIIEGEHSAEFGWTEQDSDAVNVFVSPGGSGTTLLTLAVAYAGGEVRWVDSQIVYPPGPSNLIAIECLPRLEIDSQLGFSTEDGAFAELFDVTVISRADFSGDLHWASVLHVFDPEMLAGMLEVESIEPANPDTIEYHIDFGIPLDSATDLEPGVPRGYVDGFAEYEGHGPAPPGTIAVGRFELGRFGPLDSP